MNYEEANKLLGNKQVKRTGETATTIERLDSTTIGIRYHSTIVVRIHADGSYTLDNGGWQTLTTKKRINKYTPVQIWQEQFTWYLDVDGKIIPFVNGMTINPDLIGVK